MLSVTHMSVSRCALGDFPAGGWLFRFVKIPVSPRLIIFPLCDGPAFTSPTIGPSNLHIPPGLDTNHVYQKKKLSPIEVIFVGACGLMPSSRKHKNNLK